MRAEDRAAAVQASQRVLDVHVGDVLAELLDEERRVQELRDHVAGVEVQTEARPAPDRVERALGRDEVVRDLGGVDLEREPHALLLEDVDDRVPAFRELLVSAFDTSRSGGGNAYRRCQIAEPVKPTTTTTPNAAAARAVSFIHSAARRLTPSG